MAVARGYQWWMYARLLVLLACLTGCVHSYQPISGLHRPVAIDIGAPNFTDLDLTVRCLSGPLVRPSEARLLCDRVGKLFENQGARVTTETERGVGEEPIEETPTAEAPRTDLLIQLSARVIHKNNDPFSWILCFATATLVPAVTESTFAQDVIVRDGTGFLLVQDTMEGRLVRTFGLGTWAGNKLLDWVWRPKEEELNDKATHAALSADLYRQLSQLVFNAKMRWEVLRQATPGGAATGAAP